MVYILFNNINKPNILKNSNYPKFCVTMKDNKANNRINNSDESNSKGSLNPLLTQSNWYAKLHPIGMDQQTTKPKNLLNLSIFFRIWLAVALVLILSGTLVFTQLFEHVKPTAQQVIEDTLLDTSKMLAANLQSPLQSGQLLNPTYQNQLDTAFFGSALANKGISDKAINTTNTSEPEYKRKAFSSFRLYVTDDKGKVLYDSQPEPQNAEGEDYSRWNDVYLTLNGRYGARSTPDVKSLRDSSIMYVAQPILNSSGDIIGVVSVGKPVDSVLPYLDNTRRRMLITTLIISIAALILAGLVAWWLKQSISLVTGYTSELAEDTKKPYFYLGHELNSLTDTIEAMKHRLENRAYVSDYVHTLTHELKSPLTAIRASSELLEEDDLDIEDRQLLSQTISEQSIKMQHLIDRLLLLAKVEQPSFRLNRQVLPLPAILNSLIKDSSSKLQQRHLAPVDVTINNISLKSLNDEQLNQPPFLSKTTVYADSFWLNQALQNVLDNAIHYAETMVTIDVHNSLNKISDNLSNKSADRPGDKSANKPAISNLSAVTIDIFNDGKLLPDYAIDKAFDRYFSLSHHSHSHHSSDSLIESSEISQTNKPKTLTSFNVTDTTSNNSATSTPKKGTGLGLTLVKQVIEHHGGKVIIQNVIGDNLQRSGVMVSITLPLAEVSKA